MLLPRESIASGAVAKFLERHAELRGSPYGALAVDRRIGPQSSSSDLSTPQPGLDAISVTLGDSCRSHIPCACHKFILRNGPTTDARCPELRRCESATCSGLRLCPRQTDPALSAMPPRPAAGIVQFTLVRITAQQRRSPDSVELEHVAVIGDCFQIRSAQLRGCAMRHSPGGGRVASQPISSKISRSSCGNNPAALPSSTSVTSLRTLALN